MKSNDRIWRRVQSVVIAMYLLALGGGCGGSATDTGNPSGAPVYYSEGVLGAICSKLVGCFPSLTISQCDAGVLASSSIDTQLGLASGFGTYQKIIDAEHAGTLRANALSALSCESDIAALPCGSTAVTSAYNPASPSDFSQVDQLPLVSPAHCGSVF